MALVTGRMWQCDVCGYRWMFVEGRMPTHCRDPKCRTRKWNWIAKLEAKGPDVPGSERCADCGVPVGRVHQKWCGQGKEQTA